MIARTALRRETPALRAAFLGRDARLADDDRRLADYQSASVTPASGASAAVFSIRPLAGSPAVSRLATDGRLLRPAFESGRVATHTAFSPSTS